MTVEPFELGSTNIDLLEELIVNNDFGLLGYWKAGGNFDLFLWAEV
jgi:hypothetical protein